MQCWHGDTFQQCNHGNRLHNNIPSLTGHNKNLVSTALHGHCNYLLEVLYFSDATYLQTTLIQTHCLATSIKYIHSF